VSQYVSQYAHLFLFFVLVFGIIVLPGLDMAFVMASATTGGRRSGLYAVAGIILGGVCHVAMAALGLAVLLGTVPIAFNALLIAGALYLAWIGASLLRAGATFSGVAPAATRPGAVTLRQGMLTNLLNPKAYVFMLAIFPQFVRADAGPMWSQAITMGIIIAVTQAGVYGVIALLAGRSRRWLEAAPGRNRLIGQVIGAMLIAMAAWTAIGGWRS